MHSTRPPEIVIARIPYFDMANAPASYQALLKSRNPLNRYRMLPHAGPTAPAGFLAMGSALLRDNELDSQLREIAILRVGRQVGLNDATIAALEAAPTPRYSPPTRSWCSTSPTGSSAR